jgi:hypothetical protein
VQKFASILQNIFYSSTEDLKIIDKLACPENELDRYSAFFLPPYFIDEFDVCNVEGIRSDPKGFG